MYSPYIQYKNLKDICDWKYPIVAICELYEIMYIYQEYIRLLLNTPEI